ncbi:MAG: nuclear transport factor 2 family protein [Bacteroidales bacterium]|nr:nuclear transport factor 2 family protein [Bacteroidales bacterium]
MIRLMLLILIPLISFSANAQMQAGVEQEIALIKNTIQTAYVEGLQNEGDTIKINSGFHPGFELLIPSNDGKLEKYSLTAWKAKVKASLASGKLPRKDEEKISVKFLFVDVTGDAAVAKFEFYVGQKLAYMDYQFLYKFWDGWKIVSKIFHKY